MKKQKTIIHLAAALLITALFMLLQLVSFASADSGKTNVLVYMVASDLESQHKAATNDINEMLSAAKNFGNEINLIVYAGGAAQWHNDIFSSGENRCVKIGRDGAELLYADGRQDMTAPLTLANFIKYCGKNYPAGRNILILWDHGGGFYGFGADELNDYNKPMSPLDMYTALGAGGINFDIIGFDACSMASFEVAYSICDYGKYMVASEEMEPLCGWDFEVWLSKLADNPDIDCVELSKIIADSYMDACKIHAPGIKDTMSVIDLKLCEKLGPALSDFSTEMTNEILDGRFDIISMQKVLNANIMNVNHADMIDAIEFAGSLENEKAKELKKLLEEAVLYNRKYPLNLSKSGMLIYVPINTDRVLGVALDDVEAMKSLGVSDSYLEWIKSFRKYAELIHAEDTPKRTLLDIINGTASDDYEQAIYTAINETTLDVTGCYITGDDNRMPLLIMPEEQKQLTAHICQAIYREIDDQVVDYGVFYFSPEDFPIPYEGFWKKMRDDWLFVDDILCPFYMEDTIQLSNGRTAVYGHTKVYRNGTEGALFLRLVYDPQDDSATVEPICFQDMDFSQDKLHFGRIEPVSDFDSEDTVCFCCSSHTEKKEDSVLIRISDDIKWGNIRSFELKTPDEHDIESFYASYYAIDYYLNEYELEFKF